MTVRNAPTGQTVCAPTCRSRVEPPKCSRKGQNRVRIRQSANYRWGLRGPGVSPSGNGSARCPRWTPDSTGHGGSRPTDSPSLFGGLSRTSRMMTSGAVFAMRSGEFGAARPTRAAVRRPVSIAAPAGLRRDRRTTFWPSASGRTMLEQGGHEGPVNLRLPP